MAQLLDNLLAELRLYCDLKHGRRSQVARAVGLSPQALTNILAGRQQPTGETTLRIQRLLLLAHCDSTSPTPNTLHAP